MLPNQISLHPSAITRSLGLITLFLLLISIGTTAYRTLSEHHYHPALMFDLNAEYNIPTFFSACLLLFTGLLLLVITLLEKNRLAVNVRYWGVLAWGFLFMSMDEVLSFHERLVEPIHQLLGARSMGIFYFSWVIPAILLIIVLMIYFRRFLMRLPAKTRSIFILAAAIYLGGAIGFEMIGGYFAEKYGEKNLIYSIITNAEESCEMIGVIVFINGLLVYISDHYQEVRFRIDRGYSKDL